MNDIKSERTDNLRTSTRDIHMETERHPMAVALVKGMDPEVYAVYCFNLHLIYDTMERFATERNLISEDTCRAVRLYNDYMELWDEIYEDDLEAEPPTFVSTRNHIDRIVRICEDDDKLMAHIYVRHGGDLYGGQMIKEMVPGSATVYDFADVQKSIKELESRLNDNMESEARMSFMYAQSLFDELKDWQDTHSQLMIGNDLDQSIKKDVG